MASEDEGRHVLDADVEFGSDEGAEAGGVENTGHSDDALTRESAELVAGLRHCV